MTDPPLDQTANRAFAQRVREELSRRRLSRQALADQARISLSTLEKALAGTRPFTLASTLRIEQALGLSLRPETASAPSSSTAPENMGAYARSAVAWLEGRYVTLRPSFGTPGGITAYLTTIRWQADLGYLGFIETGRLDPSFAQSGHVSLPNLSGHIYLVTNELGQYRVAILSRPTVDKTMFGVLATLQVGPGSQLVPIACPVLLHRIGEDREPCLGLLVPGSEHYENYAALLRKATTEDYVRLYTFGE